MLIIQLKPWINDRLFGFWLWNSNAEEKASNSMIVLSSAVERDKEKIEFEIWIESNNLMVKNARAQPIKKSTDRMLSIWE